MGRTKFDIRTMASDADEKNTLKKARSQAEKCRKESSGGNDSKKFRTDDNRFLQVRHIAREHLILCEISIDLFIMTLNRIKLMITPLLITT